MSVDGLHRPVLLYDANGVAIPLGQATKSASLPVTIASDNPVAEAGYTTNVQTNVVLTASSSTTVTSGLGPARDITLTINVSGSVSGTNPTLIYTIEDVDPQNTGTVVGTQKATSRTFTATSQKMVLRHYAMTGAVKISWTIGGTSSPTFNGVYTTLSAFRPGTERPERFFTSNVFGLATDGDLMMSALVNRASSQVLVRLYEVYVRNARATTTATGVLTFFDLDYLADISFHTTIDKVAYDRADTSNANVIAGHSGAASGWSDTDADRIARIRASTDEYVVGTVDVESNLQAFQQFFPSWSAGARGPIVLREGQGIMVLHQGSTTTGLFDIAMVWSEQ